MTPLQDKSNKDRVNEAIQILRLVTSGLAGEFTVEHLKAAEPLVDRYECLKWAVENNATVAEMMTWHRAQNRLDLFATTATALSPESLASHFDINDLIMSTASWYLGRHTASVDVFCDHLVEAWASVHSGVQEFIQRIVEQAFAQDDQRKQMRPDAAPLWPDRNLQPWEKVRTLWKPPADETENVQRTSNDSTL